MSPNHQSHPLAVLVNETEQIYRNPKSATTLVQGMNKDRFPIQHQTVYHLLEYASEKYADRPCMGWRNLLKIHSSEIPSTEPDQPPKIWNKYEQSNYQWITFSQAKTFADRIGQGLVDYGLGKGDFIMIFASTCPDWLLTARAAVSQNVMIVTAYDSMDENAIQQIVDQCRPKAVLVDVGTLKVMTKIIEKATRNGDDYIKLVMHTGPKWESKQVVEKIESVQGKQFSVIHLDDWKLDEEKLLTAKHNPPMEEDIFCVMYTSGTTGTPKGVMLAHSCIVSSCGVGSDLLTYGLDKEKDIYLSYLPLAHVLEFTMSSCCMAEGIRLGFAKMKTLMNDAVVGPDDSKAKGDLMELKPTLMGGVPTVWERLRKSILKEVSKKPLPVQYLFHAAIAIKLQILRLTGYENFLTRAIDQVVFNPVRQVVGGDLRLTLFGGASLSLDTFDFVNTVLCSLLSGYGLTENCSIAALTHPGLSFVERRGIAGELATSLEYKFVEVEGTDYKGGKEGGEIWIRGAPVMKGYYKNQEETDKVMTKDGWFKTGDIGSLNENGLLKIQDRVKSLVKLAHGEYVALDKLEPIYRDCPGVKNISLVAENGSPFLIAVVEPNENGASEQEVLKELKGAAKGKGLHKFETVQGVIVVDEDWTKNGFMTASNKIKRREIQKRCEDKIKKIVDSA